MQLTCPACGAKTSLEAMTEDAAARRVAALFGELPPAVARVVPAYLALFRPEKTGLRWSRVETILAELIPMVRAGFRRNHRTCKPSADAWQQAIHEVAGRNLRRPLKNHGYLLEVAAGLCEQYAAQEEAADHERRRRGHRPHREADGAPRDRLAESIEAVRHNFTVGLLTAEQRDQQIEALKGAGNGAT